MKRAYFVTILMVTIVPILMPVKVNITAHNGRSTIVDIENMSAQDDLHTVLDKVREETGIPFSMQSEVVKLYENDIEKALIESKQQNDQPQFEIRLPQNGPIEELSENQGVHVQDQPIQLNEPHENSMSSAGFSLHDECTHQLALAQNRCFEAVRCVNSNLKICGLCSIVLVAAILILGRMATGR